MRWLAESSQVRTLLSDHDQQKQLASALPVLFG